MIKYCTCGRPLDSDFLNPEKCWICRTQNTKELIEGFSEYNLSKEKRWDTYFLKMALLSAEMSRDPSTKVGSVIIKNRRIIASGFNGFPVGILDTEERLNNREEKYRIIVHSEINAVLSAAKMGISLDGSSLYLIAKSDEKLWGGAPCTRCTVELIQTGIKEIISIKRDPPERWKSDCDFAKELLKEAGIKYREVEFNG